MHGKHWDKENNAKDTIVISLDEGDDLVAKLKEVIAEYNITSGLVTFGIGQLQNFELGYYDKVNATFIRTTYAAPHELIALHGTIATLNGAPSIHIHAALGGPTNNTVAGHLFGGKVSIVNEISIQKLSNVTLIRTLDAATGLNLLDFP